MSVDGLKTKWVALINFPDKSNSKGDTTYVFLYRQRAPKMNNTL